MRGTGKFVASLLSVLVCLIGSAEASGFFVKGGVDLRPNDATDYDFVDSFLGAFGYGFGVAEFLDLEIEVQSSYQRFGLGGHVDVRIVPINGFLNARFHSKGTGPYGGGGIGYMSELAWEKVTIFPTTYDSFEYKKDLGIHFFAGVQIGRNVFVEYMGQRALEVGQIYESGWRHFVLVGARWR